MLKLNAYTGRVGTSSKSRKRVFIHKVYLGSLGKQRGRRKGGRTQRLVNSAPNQILGGRTPWVNGQDLLVQSGNFRNSYFSGVYG